MITRCGLGVRLVRPGYRWVARRIFAVTLASILVAGAIILGSVTNNSSGSKSASLFGARLAFAQGPPGAGPCDPAHDGMIYTDPSGKRWVCRYGGTVDGWSWWPEGGNVPEGFPPCDAAHDGDTYVDEDGNLWKCSFTKSLGHIWEPVDVPNGHWSTASLWGGSVALNQSAKNVIINSTGLSAKAYVAVSKPDGTPEAQPAGWISQLISFQYWTGSSWEWCPAGSPQTYTYSSTSTFYMGLAYRFPTAAPCGPGYYTAQVNAYVWDGAQWQGGGQIADPADPCVGCNGPGVDAAKVRAPVKRAPVHQIPPPPKRPTSDSTTPSRESGSPSRGGV